MLLSDMHVETVPVHTQQSLVPAGGYMMLLDTDSALSKGQSYPWRCLNIVDLWVDYPVTCEGSVAVPGPADQ